MVLKVLVLLYQPTGFYYLKSSQSIALFFFSQFWSYISLLPYKHRTLLSHRDHVKGSWLLHLRHLTPPLYRHYVLHTHTHFHLYFSIFPYFLIFLTNLSNDYISPLVPSVVKLFLRLYMDNNKPFEPHLHMCTPC